MGNCYNISQSPTHGTIDTMVKSKKPLELNQDVLKLDEQNDDDPEKERKGDSIQKSKKTSVVRQKDGTVVTTTVIQRDGYGFDDEDDFDDHSNDYGKKNKLYQFEKEYEQYDVVPNKKKGVDSWRNQIKEDSEENEEYEKRQVNGKEGPEQNLQQFINEALKAHNDLRSKHSSPPLRINKDLNQIAQKYAEKIARTNNFAHSDNEYKGDNLGENLYMCGGYKLTGKEMSQSWYDEIKDYNFKTGRSTGTTGHFTQLVWADSKEVGFGVSKAKDGSYYGVANYYPAGNYEGEYTTNVKQKRS